MTVGLRQYEISSREGVNDDRGQQREIILQCEKRKCFLSVRNYESYQLYIVGNFKYDDIVECRSAARQSSRCIAFYKLTKMPRKPFGHFGPKNGYKYPICDYVKGQGYVEVFFSLGACSGTNGNVMDFLFSLLYNKIKSIAHFLFKRKNNNNSFHLQTHILLK